MKDIRISLNGTERIVASSTSVTGLLALLDFAGKRVAVERNGEIVPRGAHAQTQLADGDRLEIVVAVGGG